MIRWKLLPEILLVIVLASCFVHFIRVGELGHAVMIAVFCGFLWRILIE